MMGRGGSWVGNSVAGLTLARFWFYQDFPAGTGPNIVLTGNENGTGGAGWDASNIVNNSAVVTKLDGNPIFSNTDEEPGQLVSVDTHLADAVTLDGTPAVGEGGVRVWYLYATSTQDAPQDMELAPDFVRQARIEFYDARFLNQDLNLSDLTNAPAARQNLGFTDQVAGQVLFGDGSTTFASDAGLFWDNGNKRLGIGTSAPGQLLDINSDSAPTILLRTQSTNVPDLRFQAARAANADLQNGDNLGQLSFYGRQNGATSVMAEIFGEYTGDGTTRLGDLVFRLSNGGAPAEVLRLESDGEIQTTKTAGAAYFDASGYLLSMAAVSPTELGYLDGVTSAIQTQLDGKQATGSYITALTGDVVATGPGSVAASIQANVVLNSMLAQMPTMTIKGNNTGGTANADDLTATEVTAMLDDFVGDSGTGGTAGLVPAPAAGDAAENKFLNADGSWKEIPPAGKAGKIDLTDGLLSQAVVFNTPLDDANYTPVVSFRNSVDTDPQYQPYTIIAQDENGFTAEWNDPIQGNNVDLLWGVMIHADP